MGRSIDLRPSPAPAEFYHRLSNRHYTVTAASMRRHQIGAGGETLNVVEKPITFAIGSGNHAITYVSRTPQQRLIELPLSWYRTLADYAMSPGYDSAEHLDFRREISPACLFCHSDRAEPAAIGCGRCHGDLGNHLRRPGRGNILNPARIDAKRQLEICLQCHLETASRGITDSLRRPGRTVFSFRPGEALQDYKLYFDRTDSASTDRFEINHAGYRLLQSRCYLASAGRMTCTTCHDPHSAKIRTDSCTQCHARPHTTGNCAGCHMPKRAASDAIHTRMTDHRIAISPRFVDPVREDQALYTGDVIDFYTHADALWLALANAREPDAGLLREAIARDPRNGALYTALGKALLRGNRPKEAGAVFRKAVALNPLDSDAQNYLGVSEAVQGNHRKAIEILLRAVASNPDHALCRLNLGITYEAMGDRAAAMAAYDEAVRLQPDSAEARRRRSALRERAR
jgi:tetratricopeptide (TPR) repeat protein